MTKIITENFRVETANEFYNSFDTQSYYVMASSIESNNAIANTQKEKREFQRNVLFGNKITSDNIKYLFANNPWQTGTVYDSFDDEKNVELTNMFVTVIDGDFGEGPYKVYKCIRNNEGATSTEKPTGTEETTLSDGYVWKYMFDVPAAEYIEYATATGLPYVANTDVVASAEENVSDIIIESTSTGLFSSFAVGTANTETNQIDPVTIESVSVDDPTENTYSIVLRTTREPRLAEGSYIGMYLRIINPGQAEAVYDILNSTATSDRLTVFVQSSTDLTTVSPSLANKQCSIVPKITVTQSTGRRCIAYGELDAEGTLNYVQFVDRGSEYKFASASVSLPAPIQDQEALTTLRVVVSPRGGHGSDPITEMYMSKIMIVSNFTTSNLTSIPGTNTYTKVGLIKNPSFVGNTTPVDFDNRLIITSNSDITSTANQNDYLEQTVNGEAVTGRIHEIYI
jgi:hypothetical protein